MRRTVACVAIVCVLGYALASVAAENGFLALGKVASSGADRPIEITSRKLNIKFGKGSAEATYDGTVKVKQGDVTMTCDRLVIDYDVKDAKPGQDSRNPKLTADMQTVSNMRSITASGNVKIVQGDRMAVAGKAVFDNHKRTIELTDNPRLWQGPDRLIGNKIVIYIDENRSEVDSEVRVIISPGNPKKEQEK
jgi:lipopolysaccharide export system protein LptA